MAERQEDTTAREKGGTQTVRDKQERIRETGRDSGAPEQSVIQLLHVQFLKHLEGTRQFGGRPLRQGDGGAVHLECDCALEQLPYHAWTHAQLK